MYKLHNNFILLIFILFSLILLTACGVNEQTAEELMRYHNEDWTELTEKRNKALKGHGFPLMNLEEKEGKQASIDYIEEIILSDFKDFLEEEQAIEIHDESVKELHELLIEADEFFYNFLKEKAPAYYHGEADEDVFLEGTEEAKKLYDKFFDYRNKLMSQNKLVIDHVRNEKGSYELRMIPRSEAKNLDGIKWGEP